MNVPNPIAWAAAGALLATGAAVAGTWLAIIRSKKEVGAKAGPDTLNQHPEVVPILRVLEKHFQELVDKDVRVTVKLKEMATDKRATETTQFILPGSAVAQAEDMRRRFEEIVAMREAQRTAIEQNSRAFREFENSLSDIARRMTALGDLESAVLKALAAAWERERQPQQTDRPARGEPLG